MKLRKKLKNMPKVDLYANDDYIGFISKYKKQLENCIIPKEAFPEACDYLLQNYYNIINTVEECIKKQYECLLYYTYDIEGQTIVNIESMRRIIYIYEMYKTDKPLVSDDKSKEIYSSIIKYKIASKERPKDWTIDNIMDTDWTENYFRSHQYSKEIIEYFS